MDKIVHELEGLETDVFYQVDYKTEEYTPHGLLDKYGYKYHCSHCKLKGNFFIKVQPGEISKFSGYPLAFRVSDIIEQKKNCPNCNVEWKQSQTGIKPRSVQKITFDNGDIMYLYQTVWPRYKDAQPVIRQNKLRIEKATGKMSFLAGDKLTYDVSTIKLGLHLLRKHFSEVPTELEYYLSRNHRLADILQYVPDQNIELFFSHVSKNLRRRIYYAYDKHGVKAAYRSILKGKGNKMLYKLLWDNLNLLDILNELLSKVDADSITNIVKCISDSHQNFETLEKLKHLFDLGLSTTKVFNIANTGELELVSAWLVRDSACMYIALLLRTNSEYKLPKYRDLANLHQLLIRDINQVEDSAAKEIMLPLTNLEEYHASEYSVKIADTAHDLNTLGSTLNICVAGYRNTVLNGNCIIAYVTKGNHMVACLQVTPSSSALVQAKLACNRPVSSDSDIERIVYSWAKDNMLNTKTGDVGFETSFEKLNKIELTYRHEASKTLPNRGRPPVFNIPEPQEDYPF